MNAIANPSEPAVNLPFDDHGVDDDAAIIDGEERRTFVSPVSIDIHDRHGAPFVGHVRRIVVFSPSPGSFCAMFVTAKATSSSSPSSTAHPHLELVVGPFDVAFADLQVRGNLARLLNSAAAIGRCAMTGVLRLA
jgi:hypothetical protein